jgi:hypothetical protein
VDLDYEKFLGPGQSRHPDGIPEKAGEGQRPAQAFRTLPAGNPLAVMETSPNPESEADATGAEQGRTAEQAI